jgi:hypothetical protein
MLRMGMQRAGRLPILNAAREPDRYVTGIVNSVTRAGLRGG